MQDVTVKQTPVFPAGVNAKHRASDNAVISFINTGNPLRLPIAMLICVMIYPMMIKVDFQSIKQVGKNPKGQFLTAHFL